VERESLRRTATMMEQRVGLGEADAANLERFFAASERKVAASMERFFAVPAAIRRRAQVYLDRLEALSRRGGRRSSAAAAAEAGLVFRRNAKLKGPVGVFGYDYFEAHHRGDKPALLAHRGTRGDGGDYAYEALNLVDGKRTVGEIADDLAAIYGPVPFEAVLGYLRALESIEVVRQPARK
jgi:aminopeptidase YwaD